MGDSPLLGPWPEWVSKDSIPSLIPCERNNVDSEAEDLLKIDYQSLPSPPTPAILPMDVTIFNFSAVLEDALRMSRFGDRLRHQKYGSEGMESKWGYTPEHLRERWREKLRQDEEDLLRSIYESSSETDESDRDPMETSEDREKKRRSRLQWASPKTKAILDKMGIETIGGPNPYPSSFPPTPLPDPIIDVVQPVSTLLTEVQSDNTYPPTQPSQELDHAESALTHPRLAKRINGDIDVSESCNAEEGPLGTTLTEAQPDNIYPHAQPSQEIEHAEWARIHPRLLKRMNGDIDEPKTCNTDSDLRGWEDSNVKPGPDLAMAISKLEEMSQNDTNSSPRTQTSQLQSPPLSITPESWVEEDPDRKAGKKRSHRGISEPLAQDSAIHCKRRRLDTEASVPDLKADISRTRESS